MAFDVRMEGPLLQVRIHGTVTPADLVALVDAVSELESAQPTTPDRITDLTGVEVDGMDVGFPEVLALAQRRRETLVKNPIRSAIVTSTVVQYGMARMFQTLNDHPQITLRIFRDREEALAWLAA
jgi:hypothetical protein